MPSIPSRLKTAWNALLGGGGQSPLATKAASSMAFSQSGGGYGNSLPNLGFGGSLTFGDFLPGSQYDYASEAGDVWLNSAVAACFSWIADNFSEPNLVVERTLSSGDTKPLPTHRFLEWHEAPNPDYDSDTLWFATNLSYYVAGYSYWIKAKAPGGSNLWTYYVPHWEMQPVWTSKTFISHYIHRVDGNEYRLEKADVVHFRRGLDPRGMRYGLAPLGAVLKEICSDNSANTYCAAILRNMGVPGVVVTPEAGVTLDADDAKEISRLWVERSSGDNSGRPLVLTSPINVRELVLTPEKMAIDKIRRVPEERICSAFKIPPSVVGLSGGDKRPTYANNAADERKAYRNCLIPSQKRFARTLNHQLLPDLGGRPNEKARWDYTDVEAMAEDQQAVAKRVTTYYSGGVCSQEEARKIAKFGPVKAGETFITPAGATIGVAGAVTPGSPAALSGPTSDTGGKPENPSEKPSVKPATADAAKKSDAPPEESGPHSLLATKALDGGTVLGALGLDDLEREDGEGPFSPDLKNCGTGAGGFRAGNTCGRRGGGRRGGGGGGGGGGASGGAAVAEQPASTSPIPRTREGTPEQRAALASQIRQARANITTPEQHTEVAQQLRVMRAVRRGQEKPEQRPRGAGRAEAKPTTPATATPKPPITRVREGTPEQRAGLASQVRQARELATTPELHAELAQRLRDMRAVRRGQPLPEVRAPKPKVETAKPKPEVAKPKPAKPTKPAPSQSSVPHTDPKLKAHVEHEKYIKSEHDAAIGRLASDAGMSPEAYRSAVGKKFAEAVDHGDFYVRADSAVLNNILADGRFKNQFETGTTRGAADLLGRTKAEAELFGTTPGVAASSRPVYGYVSRPDFGSTGKAAETRLEVYGEAAIRLKPEVRSRATVTVGDSLSRHDQVQGVPASSPNISALPLNSPAFPRHSQGLLKADSPGAVLDHLQSNNGYIEAQYHGGLKASDIAEVALVGKPGPTLRGALEQHGIPWRVIGDRE